MRTELQVLQRDLEHDEPIGGASDWIRHDHTTPASHRGNAILAFARRDRKHLSLSGAINFEISQSSQLWQINNAFLLPSHWAERLLRALA